MSTTRLDELSARIGDLVARREALMAEAEALTSKDTITNDEADRVGRLLADVDTVDADLKLARTQQEQLQALTSRRVEQQAAADALAARQAVEARAGAAPSVPSTPSGRLSVNEPEMYAKGSPHNFFADMWHYQMREKSVEHDHDAIDRMRKYAQRQLEIRNDVATTSLGGLVPTQFLLDEFAATVSAGRPFANAIRRRPLPQLGMTFTIPRGNTTTRVDWQASENAALTARDYTVSDLSVPLRTLIGGVDISTQAVLRGATTVEIHAADLVEQYVMALDLNLFNGTGSNGQHYGLLNTTGVTQNTVTVTTAVQQWKQIGRAIADIASARFQSPDLIVMHPRRAAYFMVATDTQLGRPLVTPAASYGPDNVIGQINLATGGSVVGEMHGLPVVVDANIPTNLSYDVTQGATTDIIVVTRRNDLVLMEDSPAPAAVQFDEVKSNSLTSRLVIYGFSAFAGGRYPTATRILSGSGLTTPVWT